MYLRTVYELEEEGIPPLRARIAERLEHSGPTVSQTVARMERDGLLKVKPDRSLKLSEDGRALATAVMRKHRLAERLLTDVIGLPWEKVHDEACRWEHVMGDEVEERLVEVLTEHDTSPFGNPIPGLDALKTKGANNSASTLVEDNSIRAYDLDTDIEHQARIVSINEIIQVENHLMCALREKDMMPGTDVTIINTPQGITMTNSHGELSISPELSHAIRVEVKES